MFSSEFISALAYNALPMIEEQTLLDDATLRALGSLFVSYGVEQTVGIALLHKHFILDQDTIMLNSGLTCAPSKTTTNASTTGDSFLWNGDNFQAFEYGHSKHLSLDNHFLTALANHLEARGLARQVALSRLDKDHEKLMEHCDPVTMSHVCEETEGDLLPTEATEWKFSGAGMPIITRACARTWSGDHKTKPC